MKEEASMYFKYSFTSMGCQKCRERTNCKECEKKIKSRFSGFGGMLNFFINMLQKEPYFEAGQEKKEAILDLLEGMGIFVNL